MYEYKFFKTRTIRSNLCAVYKALLGVWTECLKNGLLGVWILFKYGDLINVVFWLQKSFFKF